MILIYSDKLQIARQANMRLETSRLYIRRLCETDWREMKNIFIDFNNSKYALYDMPLPTEEEEPKALTTFLPADC